MKKVLFISMLATFVSLMSYAQQNDSAHNRSMSFKLTTNDKVKTRTGETYRYILSVYKGTDVSGERVHHSENSTGNFPVTLEQNVNYVCLFWADGGTVDDNANGTYNASDLRAVILNTDEEVTEAFFSSKAILITTPTANNITLKRAVARVNLIEEGTVAADTDLVVTFAQYNSFNTYTSSVIGTATSISKTFNSSATTGHLGSFLTLASFGTQTTGGIITDFLFLFGTVTNNRNDVLLSANHPTSIRGNYGE